MPDTSYGIRLTADAGSFIGASKQSVAAQKEMSEAAQKTAQSLRELTNTNAQLGKQIEGVTQAANAANFRSSGETWGKAIGEGLASGLASAKANYNNFLEETKAQSLAWTVAIGAAFAAVGAGALYAGYKVVAGGAGFAGGLLTGSSYKQDSVDAIVKQAQDQRELQALLRLSQAEAVATGAALKALGLNQEEFAGTLEKVDRAVNENADELDRLGVRYRSANGDLLSHVEVLKNAKGVIEQFSAGYHQNAAAAAIGMGSLAQINAALEVNQRSLDGAAERAREYGTILGEFGASEAARYEAAMKSFNVEIELTKQGFQRAIGDAIMPLLTDLAEFFSEGFPTAVRAFRFIIAEVTALFYGLKTAIYIAAETILAAIQSIAAGVGGVASAIAKAATGDFKGAWDELKLGAKGFEDRWKLAFDNILAQARGNRDKILLAFGFDEPSTTPGATGGTRRFVPKAKERPAAGGGGVDPFESLIATLERERARLNSEAGSLAAGLNPADSAKLAEITAALRFDPRYRDFSDPQREQALAAARGVDTATLARASQQDLAGSRASTDRLRAEVELFERYGRTVKFAEEQLAEFEVTKRGRFRNADDETKAQLVDQARERDLLASRAALVEFRTAQRDSIEQTRFETQLIGQSTLAQRQATAARAIDLEVRQRTVGMSAEMEEALRAEAAVQKGEVIEAIEERWQIERDMYQGITTAAQSYIETVTNQAQNMRDAFGRITSGMENLWVRFVTTGKLSARDLVTTVLAEVARLQFRKNLAEPLSGFISGGLKSIFGGGGADPTGAYSQLGVSAADFALAPFAQGGVVDRPTLFRFAAGAGLQNGLMGEAGPEAIMPLRRGADGKLGVAATGAAGAGISAVRVEIVNESGSRLQVESASPRIEGGELVVGVVLSDLSTNGPISQGLQNRFALR